MQSIISQHSLDEPYKTHLSTIQQTFRDNLPRTLRCANDYCSQVFRTPENALQKRYIAPNPAWERNVMLLDADMQYAAVAWEFKNLPEPSFVTVNPKSHHAHYGYMLTTPVLMGYNNSSHPMRYLAAIERAFVAKLGADTGYSGHLTQNPLHDHWVTTWGHSTYDLADLAEYVELRSTPQKSTEAQGEGRNCDMFDAVRRPAYKDVRLFRPSRYKDFQDHVFRMLMAHTSENHSVALYANEVQHTARSIASWTWENITEEGFKEKQKFRSQLGVMAKKQKSAERRIKAVEMKAGGATQKLIADTLGVSRMTIHRLLKSNPKPPLVVSTSDLGNVTSVSKGVPVCKDVHVKKVVETKKRPEVRKTVRADKQDLVQVVKLHLAGKAHAEIMEATGLPMREVFAHILTAQKREII